MRVSAELKQSGARLIDAEKELAREQSRASSLEAALGVSKQDLSKLQDEKTS